MDEQSRTLETLAASETEGRRSFAPHRVVTRIVGAVVVVLLAALLMLAGWATHQWSGGYNATFIQPRDSGFTGEPVRDGQFEFLVGRVSCGASQLTRGDTIREAHGYYCTAPIRISNIGDQERAVHPENLKAHLSDNSVVTADRGATRMLARPEPSPFRWLPTGEEVTFTLVFDIAPTATITYLKLHDLAFSQGGIVTIA